jgi:hypothetical protein
MPPTSPFRTGEVPTSSVSARTATSLRSRSIHGQTRCDNHGDGGTPPPCAASRRAGSTCSCCTPLADGGFAWDDGYKVFRLRRQRWETHDGATSPTERIFDRTAVGNLVVSLVFDSAPGGKPSLRVIP